MVIMIGFCSGNSVLLPKTPQGSAFKSDLRHEKPYSIILLCKIIHKILVIMNKIINKF